MDSIGHVHHMLVTPSSMDALQWIGFTAIFSYSFLTSLHCVGMCGPLACSILGRSGIPSWRSSLFYNLGRGLSYMAAGALAGSLTAALKDQWPLLSTAIATVFGVLVCLWSLNLIFEMSKRLPFLSFPAPYSWLKKGVASLSPNVSAFLLGVLTLFLPCMTLHPLLFMSAAHQSALGGLVTLFAFWLGTLPAMVSATCMPSLIPSRFHAKIFTKIAQIFLLLAGLITILRGWITH